MKVMILGSGARENALAWKFSKSNLITGLFVAPGNAGCADVAVNLDSVDPNNGSAVVAACQEYQVDLVFVGSEAPLEAGVIDALTAAGIAAIGPNKHCAQLESSKVFSKAFMVRNKIPTADAREFKAVAEFEAYLKAHPGKIVVKKSGLAAGKGVLETDKFEEALEFGKAILKDDKLLVEEFLTGFEVSVFVLSDGKDFVVLPPTADFKKAKENDQGPNTGGMGAICPVPSVTPALWQRIGKEVVETTMQALNKDGLNYKGIIFIGVMVTAEGPKVLEYNVRFGDPETQVLLPLIRSDFGNLVRAMADGTLGSFNLELSNQAALGVVVAAQGYPGPYAKNVPIASLPEDLDGKSMIYHASTVFGEDRRIETEGGRCFTCVGVAEDHFEAQKRAYKAAEAVKFPGAWFRKDIGDKFMR